MSEGARQRIDKWLWFARVVKTRTLAQKLVLSGAVRINREKCDSASQPLKPGDVLTIAVGRGIRVLKVAAPGTRRGPAEEARTLYEDLSPPSDPAAPRASAGPRPTKRDRRALDAFRDDFPADGD
jgi:ribosome-associated heat shock protein Hsp15